VNRFSSAAAFRQALEERLRQSAGPNVGRLRKRLAMERLLLRLQGDQGERWLLKGGVALELRLRGKARSTVDLDLEIDLEVSQEADAPGLIRERLMSSILKPNEDFFSFGIVGKADPRLAIEGIRAYRFAVDAGLAGRLFDRFRIDIVLESAAVSHRDTVPGSGLLSFAGIERESFEAVTLARHLAEKIHAYSRPRENRTRVKDLIDILLIRRLDFPDVAETHREINAVFEERETHGVPQFLPAPPGEWKAPFESEARRTGLGAITLEDASESLQRVWAELMNRSED
jgi:predicted nucleotidyltransferase component of viral defense system